MRSRVTGKWKLGVAIALLTGVTGAIAVAAATGHDSGSTRAQLSALSNGGRQIALSGSSAKAAKFMGIRTVYLMAVRGRRAYYRLTGPGVICFGGGPAKSIGTIGGAECDEGSFPTARHPVIDFSVYEGTSRTERSVSIYRAEGFAADGVAEVGFVRADGTTALRVPVKNNVFSTSKVARGAIAGVVAYDGAGAEVWRSP